MGGVIVVFICVIGAMIWGIRAGKKRRDSMTLLSEKLGFKFSHERDYQLADRFSFLDKWRRGSNRYACNIMEGCYQEHDVTIFDYHYETYSSDSDGKRTTDHHHFSFFMLMLPKHFEELTIAKESFFSKVEQAAGYDDIDFESHEFSKQFVVRTKNKKFAYDFCHARMIEFLLGHSEINIEVGQNMLAIGYTTQLKVDEIESHLNRLIEIRERMPDYLFGD